MDIFTLIKVQSFVEKRINQNADWTGPEEPNFDNPVNEELWKVRAFLSEAIKLAEIEVEKQITNQGA